MGKYNVYQNADCVYDGDNYDEALQEYTDCINDDPDSVTDLYEVDDFGHIICLEGIN